MQLAYENVCVHADAFSNSCNVLAIQVVMHFN
jgi:hypothetical protein